MVIKKAIMVFKYQKLGSAEYEDLTLTRIDKAKEKGRNIHKSQVGYSNDLLTQNASMPSSRALKKNSQI
jgi:hypothetical protein